MMCGIYVKWRYGDVKVYIIRLMCNSSFGLVLWGEVGDLQHIL